MRRSVNVLEAKTHLSRLIERVEAGKRSCSLAQDDDDMDQEIGEIDASGFEGLPVTLADGDRASRLPMHHRDPFDRMLVAQAAHIEAAIVSRDAAFAAYEVDVLPA